MSGPFVRSNHCKNFDGYHGDDARMLFLGVGDGKSGVEEAPVSSARIQQRHFIRLRGDENAVVVGKRYIYRPEVGDTSLARLSLL